MFSDIGNVKETGIGNFFGLPIFTTYFYFTSKPQRMGLEKETFKLCTAFVSDQSHERIPTILLNFFCGFLGNQWSRPSASLECLFTFVSKFIRDKDSMYNYITRHSQKKLMSIPARQYILASIHYLILRSNPSHQQKKII